MEYVYLKSEASLWTVGHYNPEGKFIPERDCDSPDEAARRVAWLNGGCQEQFITGSQDENIHIEINPSTLVNSSSDEVLDLVDALSAQVRKMKLAEEEIRRRFPRVFKLIKKNEYFIVIGKHEPYFVNAYSLIRDQEIRQGTWSVEDEENFLANVPACYHPVDEISVKEIADTFDGADEECTFED